ncbi:hypothetical protein [Haloarchaeobius salinus]|uniref:hypothetical protein n=1 Tax=Haloarchaeobius salinus TaxID=1198298 RepID=UPI002109E152|nr:hypothetical protein [Haloarchaeobius salinus]
MIQDETRSEDTGRLYRIAGVTGLGWTVSLLAYLTTLLGYGNAVVARLVGSPRALLYLGGGLFVATLGLDRLRGDGADDESGDGSKLQEAVVDEQPE